MTGVDDALSSMRRSRRNDPLPDARSADDGRLAVKRLPDYAARNSKRSIPNRPRPRERREARHKATLRGILKGMDVRFSIKRLRSRFQDARDPALCIAVKLRRRATAYFVDFLATALACGRAVSAPAGPDAEGGRLAGRRDGFDVRGRSRPARQATRRGIRRRAKRQTSRPGRGVGGCMGIVVFTSTARAAILMRRDDRRRGGVVRPLATPERRHPTTTRRGQI